MVSLAGRTERFIHRWRAWLPWCLIGALALAVRLHALDRFSYWLDEVLEVYRIHAPWKAMLSRLREELLNPPLDYVVQKAFNVLGPSDAARRILPALWGTGFVLTLGALVGRRSTTRVGWAAAVCLALSPIHVHYSQEVRPYSLGLFLTALTLLLIDRYLDAPGGPRLLAVLVAAVAVAYTLFLGALVLGLAGSALVVEDAVSGSDLRRASARRLLRWSPALMLVIALAWWPWLPSVWKSFGLPAFSTPPVFEWQRVGRFFSVFGFGLHDWYPLGRPGALFLGLVAGGAVLAVTTYRLRFLVVWAVLGLAIIELLEERHGVYDSIFHFLPAGIALPALAALPIGWLAERRGLAWAAGAVLLAVVFLDARALAFYFERGRVDWRPVGAFLRSAPADVPILVAGASPRLTLGYYVNGPGWLCCPDPAHRAILDVGNEAEDLLRYWRPSQAAWLVVPSGAKLRDDAPLSGAPGVSYPTADGGVIVRRLGAGAIGRSAPATASPRSPSSAP